MPRHSYYDEIDEMQEELRRISRLNTNDTRKPLLLPPFIEKVVKHPLWKVTVMVDGLWEDTSIAERRTSAALLDVHFAEALNAMNLGTFNFRKNCRDVEES